MNDAANQEPIEPPATRHARRGYQRRSSLSLTLAQPGQRPRATQQIERGTLDDAGAHRRRTVRHGADERRLLVQLDQASSLSLRS